MNYDKAREVVLLELHKACEKAYSFDRDIFSNNSAANSGEYLGTYYGVFKFSDWPAHVLKLENEMISREIAFIPIKLTP